MTAVKNYLIVDNIIKSDDMTTTTTTIGKLFADMVPMKVIRFLGICGI